MLQNVCCANNTKIASINNDDNYISDFNLYILS